MDFSTDLNKWSILVVGRDGNGKTSCKRTIENLSDEIKVVDISGVGDTGSDRLDDINIVKNNLKRIMEECDGTGGINAIVFVLKYGVRFTQQEKDAVVDVKAMLGEDVFRYHGIVLMTYGDLFEVDHSEDGGDFMDWCREQTGDIKKLFEEVNYRIVLFNNRTNDFEIKRKQFDEIKSIVNSMDNSYGLIEFNSAQKLTQTQTLNKLITFVDHDNAIKKCVYLGLLITVICIVILLIGLAIRNSWLIFLPTSCLILELVIIITLRAKRRIYI